MCRNGWDVISLRESMAALELVREMERDLMAEYPGVTVGRTDDAEMDSVGTMDVRSVYLKAWPPDRIRIFIRMDCVEPYIHPPLILPQGRPASVNIKVHPEEPWLNFRHDGMFMRMSMDRLGYVLNKQRYMRVLRFVLDAEKLEVAGDKLLDFEDEGNLMVRD
jgi:hypothetical protein